jgi:hypothetical protein
VLIDKGILCSQQLVLQPAVVRPQDLHHGVEGLILPSVLVEVLAQLGKVVELFTHLAL